MCCGLSWSRCWRGCRREIQIEMVSWTEACLWCEKATLGFERSDILHFFLPHCLLFFSFYHTDPAENKLIYVESLSCNQGIHTIFLPEGWGVSASRFCRITWELLWPLFLISCFGVRSGHWHFLKLPSSVNVARAPGMGAGWTVVFTERLWPFPHAFFPRHPSGSGDTKDPSHRTQNHILCNLLTKFYK